MGERDSPGLERGRRQVTTCQNTLIYVLVNLHALQRVRQRKAERSG
jgi:hypothetical protein